LNSATTVFRNRSVLVQALCSDNDLTFSGYFAVSHNPIAAPSDKPLMCADGISNDCMNAETSSAKSSVEYAASGLSLSPVPRKVDRKTGEVLRVFSHLKRVATIICGQKGDENEWFAVTLLFIVYRDVVRFYFRHEVVS
jgi:hypothetical protein